MRVILTDCSPNNRLVELHGQGELIAIHVGDGGEPIKLNVWELLHACISFSGLYYSQQVAHPISFIGDFKGRTYP